jgi:hypothetical protein
MIVYYDIIADKEIASDSFDETSPVPGIKAIEGKRITVQEGEVDIGGNASAEAGEEDEGVDASEVQQVINVVHAARLSKVELSKAEYKVMQKSYWKKLVETLNRVKFEAVGFASDYTPPADKAEAAAALAAAENELSVYDRKAYDIAAARIGIFKKNFEGLQKFVADEILADFDNCEFYTCEEAELGSCMLIPARYVGEAVAPTFYFFEDGIRAKKE